MKALSEIEPLPCFSVEEVNAMANVSEDIKYIKTHFAEIQTIFEEKYGYDIVAFYLKNGYAKTIIEVQSIATTINIKNPDLCIFLWIFNLKTRIL